MTSFGGKLGERLDDAIAELYDIERTRLESTKLGGSDEDISPTEIKEAVCKRLEQMNTYLRAEMENRKQIAPGLVCRCHEGRCAMHGK